MKKNRLFFFFSLIVLFLSGCVAKQPNYTINNINDVTSEITFSSAMPSIPKEHKYELDQNYVIKSYENWRTKLASKKSEVKIKVKKGQKIKSFKSNKPFFVIGITVTQDAVSHLGHTKKGIKHSPLAGIITSPLSLTLDILDIDQTYRTYATEYLVETYDKDFKLKSNYSMSGTETYNLSGFTKNVDFSICEYYSGHTSSRYRNRKKDPIVLNNVSIYGTYDWLNIALDIYNKTKSKNEFKTYMHNYLIEFDSDTYYKTFFDKVGKVQTVTLKPVSEEKAIEIILQNI